MSNFFEVYFNGILENIESRAFAREWENLLSKLKFKLIKFFAMRQNINKIEKSVRGNLALVERDFFEEKPPTDEEFKALSAIKEKLDSFEDAFGKF